MSATLFHITQITIETVKFNRNLVNFFLELNFKIYLLSFIDTF